MDQEGKIGKSLHEPLEIHTNLTWTEREKRVKVILNAVNLPEAHLDLYPHEISGGQQRRIGLARILTLHPSLIILDEPTSGLDVSVQATILNLFLDLQKQFNLTYIFISHDLSVVRMICDRVAVMYAGFIVETGTADDIFFRPKHRYTSSLLKSLPTMDKRSTDELASIPGIVPSLANLKPGCPFMNRCDSAVDKCAEENPLLEEMGKNHMAACWNPVK